jgi:hypothetical protein
MDQIVERVVDDSVVLYDLERQRVHLLNQTAAVIWYLCTGELRVAEIAEQVVRDFPASRDVVEQDIAGILRAFADEHLLCAGSGSPPGG